jgi:hypothetical protein
MVVVWPTFHDPRIDWVFTERAPHFAYGGLLCRDSRRKDVRKRLRIAYDMSHQDGRRGVRRTVPEGNS